MLKEHDDGSVEFEASLAPLISAILLGKRGSGAKVKLEISGTDRMALLYLHDWSSGVKCRASVWNDDREIDSVTFNATIPVRDDSLCLDGGGDGGRVHLSLPHKERGAAIVLHEWAARGHHLFRLRIRKGDMNGRGVSSAKRTPPAIR